MPIANQPYKINIETKGTKLISGLVASKLFKRSLSSKKLSRDFPVLAGLHRITDGALIGFAFIVVVMSIVSLHTQHLWTLSFSRLEASRSLIHKLKESISVLESHFLSSSNLSTTLIETKTSNLEYLDKPDMSRRLQTNNSKKRSYIRRITSFPLSNGY
ncbi:hypothetical protein [Prochlorococcus sp. MIT 1223]|uniref:hypothetical protein n=1 Tax=Prochlorococcus sp. MIT 1223 TaxID=3096217 RepID=UPI002A765AC8|nr:hypothetical protein [Prochlorococcus sp. MIT 1223]